MWCLEEISSRLLSKTMPKSLKMQIRWIILYLLIQHKTLLKWSGQRLLEIISQLINLKELNDSIKTCLMVIISQRRENATVNQIQDHLAKEFSQIDQAVVNRWSSMQIGWCQADAQAAKKANQVEQTLPWELIFWIMVRFSTQLLIEQIIRSLLTRQMNLPRRDFRVCNNNPNQKYIKDRLPEEWDSSNSSNNNCSNSKIVDKKIKLIRLAQGCNYRSRFENRDIDETDLSILTTRITSKIAKTWCQMLNEWVQRPRKDKAIRIERIQNHLLKNKTTRISRRLFHQELHKKTKLEEIPRRAKRLKRNTE